MEVNETDNKVRTMMDEKTSLMVANGMALSYDFISEQRVVITDDSNVQLQQENMSLLLFILGFFTLGICWLLGWAKLRKSVWPRAKRFANLSGFFFLVLLIVLICVVVIPFTIFIIAQYF